MHENKTLNYLYLLLAQFMVGVSIVGSKSLVSGLSSITILNIRFGIAFVFLSIMLCLFSKRSVTVIKELTSSDWVFIVAQALCAGALFNIFLLYGLNYTSASIAGIITSALPAIIAIMSVIFLRERLTFFTILCISFAIIGLIIINLHNFHSNATNNLIGDLMILISLLPEAAYYVLTKIHKNKLPVFLVSALMTGINIPMFFLIGLFTAGPIFTPLTTDQIILLMTIGMASAFFYTLWFLGSQQVRGTSAALTTAFMPIATLLIASLFLGESISLLQAFGMVLVIASIVFHARS